MISECTIFSFNDCEQITQNNWNYMTHSWKETADYFKLVPSDHDYKLHSSNLFFKSSNMIFEKKNYEFCEHIAFFNLLLTVIHMNLETNQSSHKS